MILSPIVIFVYNRPLHTRHTIEALQKNELANESELFIYSDAPKNESIRESVEEVRAFIKSIQGFKKINIIEREKNWGLANSIIDGVTSIINEYGKIIVLEDDLVTSPYFLRFMNHNLDLYSGDDQVASIHGYVYPINDLPEVFFLKGADCWGWATWKRAWNLFESDGNKLLQELYDKNLQKEADFNNSYGYTQMLKNQIAGKNNSWAVRWYMSAFLKGKVTLYPGESHIENIGLDNSGTHCGVNTNFNVTLTNNLNLDKIEIIENKEARLKFETFFKKLTPSLLKKISRKLRMIFS
ncbi:MAG: glycosyltransferase [Leptospiraceae bacterium]|nr:glycosyltransferase [Leptospiraceae bacterium]